MLTRKALGAALLALCTLALVAPAAAPAASVYVVNTTNDEPGTVQGQHECKTAEDFCSLRAAIEVVDEEEGPTNKISFDPSIFNGEEEDAVRVQGSSLPAIEFPTTIEAGTDCTTATIVGAPCAGVTGWNNEPVFVVDADNTTIKGLSISEGSVGVEVEESTGFKATGNWIGIEMSGSNALPAFADGILLGHGSDGATIGGSGTGERNVIAFNDVGLEIRGASDATVRGNFFGVTGDGETPGPEEVDIRIENAEPTPGTEVQAEDNEIGAVLGEGAQQSAACDGGCNVISGAQQGIALYGSNPLDLPASGPTTIHGNYIGLDYAGDKAVKVEGLGGFEGNRFEGVSAGAAKNVTVGGEPRSEANYVVGGGTGIASEDGDGFEARGNRFGYSGSGGAATPPSTRAIYLFMAGTADPPVVVGNRIQNGESEATGIQHSYIGATITGNIITGGEVGISSEVTPATGRGSLIEGNTVEGTSGPGIFVSNAGNEIRGNKVFGAAETGIEVESGTVEDDGNVVGGDTPEAENVISEGGGFAIVIEGGNGTRNEIQANHGSGNEGELGFIVLRDVPNHELPNGVEEPTIESAGKTEASGKAEPHAIVRAFYKASPEPGELGGFLGKAEADGSGNWKVTYGAPVPGETLITATQTLNHGTSMLTEPVKTPADKAPPPCPEPGATGCETTPPVCPAAGATGCPPLEACLAAARSTGCGNNQLHQVPKVTIKAGPKSKSTKTTAKFKFVSNEAGSKFKCKLDKKAFANCTSPKTYKKLKPGNHVFKVKAVDPAGNVSAVVTRKFKILAS